MNDVKFTFSTTDNGENVEVKDEIPQVQESAPAEPKSPTEQVIEEVKKLSIEDKARESGWVSLEEWKAQGKDPEDWRSAKDYVDRGSLFARIEADKKERDQLKAMIDSMAQTLSKAEERAYQKALNDVLAQREQAKLTGDLEAYEQALKHEQQVRGEYRHIQKQSTNVEANRINEIQNTDYWKRFEAKNREWLHGSDPLAKAKQAYATQVALQHNGTPDEQVLEIVDRMVSQTFSVQPQSVRVPMATPGASARPVAAHSGELDRGRLTSEQRNMIRYLENSGDKSGLEHYLKALKAEQSSSKR